MLMQMTQKKQSGFTLVEIAIVLVVIGLLLGGILKGQQLINSARVRNMADQNSAIQSSYYGFIDRFRNLPGDMSPYAACTNIGGAIDVDVGTGGDCGTPASPNADVGGDGDGRIQTIGEAGYVWAHLSVAGFLTGTYSGTQTDGTALDNTSYPNAVAIGAVPPNAFQGPILLAHSASYLNNANVTRLIFSFGGNIPVPLLRDLDQKLDDGAAGTGVLRSSVPDDAAVDAFSPVVGYTPTPDCVSANAWDVDSANQDCNAIFLY